MDEEIETIETMMSTRMCVEHFFMSEDLAVANLSFSGLNQYTANTKNYGINLELK